MSSDEDEKSLPFHEMGLDDRLLKAIAKLGWAEPTLIQERAVPLILEVSVCLIKHLTIVEQHLKYLPRARTFSPAVGLDPARPVPSPSPSSRRS